MNRKFFLLTLTMTVILSGALALQAQGPEGGRPPVGYARPPFHVRGNADLVPRGLSPASAAKAYGLNGYTNAGAGQTIAIIDAYDHPNIESDLGVFSTTYGLPSCTTANGCFQKVAGTGNKLPRGDAGWGLEIALDVEWAHAIAPAAHIVLVEAKSNSFADLMQAIDTAVTKYNANVVSMSFGGNEFASEVNYDFHFSKWPNVTFVASSGDNGYGVEYPAASPYVLAVGGTTLNLSSDGTWGGESAWSGSGGGVSAYEGRPSYQGGTSGGRVVPDVAYDADPNTGFAVYDSYRYQSQSGWFMVGGTSAGAPQWAALTAIANSLRAPKNPLNSTDRDNRSFYSVYSGLTYHDITNGSNGTCGATCNAGPNYDAVTGLGSPKAPAIIDALVLAP